MERSNAESEYYFSRDFFETLNQMKNNIMYFHVMFEDKIISMNHLGFSDMQTLARLRIEVKKYIENSEKYKYDFVNSAEKFDYSVDFLYD